MMVQGRVPAMDDLTAFKAVHEEHWDLGVEEPERLHDLAFGFLVGRGVSLRFFLPREGEHKEHASELLIAMGYGQWGRAHTLIVECPWEIRKEIEGGTDDDEADVTDDLTAFDPVIDRPLFPSRES